MRCKKIVQIISILLLALLLIWGEYLTKCEFAYSMIDGLQGWYNEGGRGQALNMMFKNHNAPATVVDSMKGVIADCLRKTVG